jgi:hypothetical protein
VAIDWSEISNPPAFSSDWNSITGKPSTYPPSTHGHDWSQITGVPPSSGGSVTYNVINSSPAFVEEFDDFLSLNSLNKLGWSHSSQNGWGGSQPGNRFPGTSGVYALGINNSTAGNDDWSHLRLGNFPIIPQLREGYSNLEISSAIGINQNPQTEESWAARFGLLDTGAGLGTTSSILISAEYYLNAYNWVAIWRDGINQWQKQVIVPITGDLSTKVFDLKIRIDCENYQINFSVDGTGIEVVIGQANWQFQAMSPIFYIVRLNVPSPGRTFWIDKFLMRKNISTEQPPAIGVEWVDVTNKPDFDSLYRQIAEPVDWSDLANIPVLVSDWNSITGKPTTFPPSAHEHNWEQITDRPFEQYTHLDGAGTTARTWVGGSGEILQWLWRTNGQHEFGIYDGNLDTMFRVERNPGGFGYRLVGVALETSENLAYSWGSGWSEYSSTYSARYRRLDRLVLCQGLIKRTTTTGTLIATLPGGFRPSSRRLFGCQSSQGYTRVDVDTSGQILLVSPNPAAAISWLSLDGISFFTS